ncbi:DUF2905 family protein [Cupriavidus basilensis]
MPILHTTAMVRQRTRGYEGMGTGFYFPITTRIMISVLGSVVM